MRVRANQLGFDGISLREPGEEFDLPDEVHVLDPRTGQREKDADGKDKKVPFVIPANAWFELVTGEEEAPRRKRG